MRIIYRLHLLRLYVRARISYSVRRVHAWLCWQVAEINLSDRNDAMMTCAIGEKYIAIERRNAAVDVRDDARAKYLEILQEGK